MPRDDEAPRDGSRIEDRPRTHEPEPEPAPAGDTIDDVPPHGPEGRFSRLRRRFLDRRDLAEDTKELIGAVLETSDRAKSEMVRMVAREVRHYLDELRLKEDLRDLVTSHSLEVQMSLSLKPLSGREGLEDEGDEPDEEPG